MHERTFWKHYQTQINTTFEHFEVDINNIEKEAKHIQKALKSCALTAYQQKNQSVKHNLTLKSWWTNKNNLPYFYNMQRNHNFSYCPDNIHYNQYKFDCKKIRKAVNIAQNTFLTKHFVKHDHLKKTNSQKFWSKSRQLKRQTNQRYQLNLHFNYIFNTPRLELSETNIKSTDLAPHLNTEFSQVTHDDI